VACLRLPSSQQHEACSAGGSLDEIRRPEPDPFGGSGTTLVVAKKLGRRYLGFELSADYAAQIRSRLDAVKVGQPLEAGAEPLAGGKGRAARSRGG
jgi:site-specific DNA-methyltransferase (adenine-specific)